jgi:four helix bundle suffix protein
MGPHGGYRTLKSFQTATLIYDLTVLFCEKFIRRGSRNRDQMEQAARSGRQNIAEGSQASATSKKTEIKLVGVARASLEELLIDYEDYLRQHGLRLWERQEPQVVAIRQLGYKTNRSYRTYMTYIQTPEGFCNTVICLIHQANFLLDRQLQDLEKTFIEGGGYTENLFKKRLEKRRQ